jgi:hypothetical protein
LPKHETTALQLFNELSGFMSNSYDTPRPSDYPVIKHY